MGNYEEWLKLSTDGKLILHFELDGPGVLKHGLEQDDRPITLEEVKKHYPNLLPDALRLLNINQ